MHPSTTQNPTSTISGTSQCHFLFHIHRNFTSFTPPHFRVFNSKSNLFNLWDIAVPFFIPYSPQSYVIHTTPSSLIGDLYTEKNVPFRNISAHFDRRLKTFTNVPPPKLFFFIDAMAEHQRKVLKDMPTPWQASGSMQ